MDTSFNLDGKSAVVTGGTGVLGGAMAKALAQAGANVGILGRNKEAADQCVKEIEQDGGNALSLIADVLKKPQLKDANQQVIDAWGKVDIIVNAAGGNMPGATVTPDESILDIPDEDLQRVVNLNFLGSFWATQVLGESIIKQKEGVIINISSMAAQKPLTRVMGYAASKAAIDNYTKWLASEMALKYGEGIRVNAIAPGFFIGDQNKDLLLEDDDSLTNRGQTIIDHTPMRRFGKPEELAGTLIWLCSDASRFVTGTIIPVDGGFSAFSGI